MIGKSTVAWIALASLASVILYQTSYEVQEQADRLASLNRQIVAEQDAIQVLRAEWAYLNDPARLERLVAQHLLLQPTQAAQIVALDAIPEKAAEGELLLSALPVPTPGRKPVPHGRPAPDVQVAETRPSGPAPSGPVHFARFGDPR